MQPDSREYLAAERTLLAYVRTGLSMMGFGFVIARFSLFLRELAFTHLDSAQVKPGMSLWFGTALVFAGVGVMIIAIFEYRQFIARLNLALNATWPVSKLATGTAVVLAIFGVSLAFYLMSLA